MLVLGDVLIASSSRLSQMHDFGLHDFLRDPRWLHWESQEKEVTVKEGRHDNGNFGNWSLTVKEKKKTLW